ncbi:hypothetical protein KJ966_30810 [bacterium]|nr:hypothetical protein [bacterium]
MTIQKIFEKYISQIDIIIATTCRKKNITGVLAGDFGSYVYEKLLENNGKRLLDFQGDYGASWGGYLSIVITRLAIDFTKKHWGRWENSTAARMLGEASMRFEALIYRDKYSFSEASQTMLDNPSYRVFYRISIKELTTLSSVLEKPILKKLEEIAKVTLYNRVEFLAILEEVLNDEEIKRVKNHLGDFEVLLSIQLLEEWDLLFQGRLLPLRPVPVNIGIYKDEDHDDELDVLENIEDGSKQGPLEQLLDKEMKSQLESKIGDLMEDIGDRDWMILIFYLVDNLRISEIARIMDDETTYTASKKREKIPVSSKSWKYVNRRIQFFTDQLKTSIEMMNIDREDWEAVAQYCLYLISKKLQKKKLPSSI